MKIRYYCIYACLLAACAAMYSPAASAQQPLDTPARQSSLKDQQVMNEVVVTGQYAAGSAEKAVQKIKVIDRKRIDAMSAQNLRDVLTNEMNIRLSQDNILGSSLSLQGISGENVKILMDGVPVIGRQDGNIDLSQINLNNVERIEIIEGPMSVNYGTNAIAGTINMITKKTQANLMEAGLSSYYESIGTYNIGLRVGVHKKKHTISFAGGRNYFDGWSSGDKISLDLKPHIADSSRVQQWKPREQYMGGMQYQYKAGNTTLNYKADYFNEKITNRGMPSLPYGESAFDDYYTTNRIDNAFFLNSVLSRSRNINFLVAYNVYKRTKNTWYDDLTTLHRSLSANDGDQDTSKFHSVNSRATFGTSTANTKVNYEAGYDINVEDAVGSRIADRKKQIGDYAAFASAEYRPVEQLTIRPGIRYGYNTNYAAPVVPSLNIRYKLNVYLTVRGSYAKGFRSPTLKELYFYFVDINHNIVGNEHLKAEYSDNCNLSAVYAKGNGGYNYKIEVSAFYNDIRDLIALAQLAGTEYSYVNIGKYKTKGLQANADIGIKNLKASVGGSYIGAYNQLSETQGVAAFSFSPEVRGSMSYEFADHGVIVAAFYKYTGRMQGYTIDASNSLRPTFINAYNTADVSVSKVFFEKRLNVAVGSKNLFDVKNIASYAAGGAHSSAGSSIPISSGRLYFIKMGINLKQWL